MFFFADGDSFMNINLTEDARVSVVPEKNTCLEKQKIELDF